jgi:hypothetical protein
MDLTFTPSFEAPVRTSTMSWPRHTGGSFTPSFEAPVRTSTMSWPRHTG